MSKMLEQAAMAIMTALVVQRLDDAENGIDNRRREVTMAECRTAARAAIETHREALAEAGLVIVPREPTEAMWRAGVTPHRADTNYPITEWRKMINAALADD